MGVSDGRSAAVVRDGPLIKLPQRIHFALSFCVGIFLVTANDFLVSRLYADTHTTGVPQLNSLSDAPYTLYLDFAGFNFTGIWGGIGAPGNTPAFDNITGTFNAAEQERISQVWARVAQCYTPFNVNVTTIDPAVAAGVADTDAHRQAYYDQTPRMMHTVIGEQQEDWCGHYGGISFVGVAQSSYGTTGNYGAGGGLKTNWVFTDGVGTGLACGQAAAHENGHGLGLVHQSDYNGDTKINEYSRGDNNSGFGTYAPIMGAAYYTQRGAWRVGDANAGMDYTQNDVVNLLNNDGIGGYVEDSIGHTIATATPIPLNGKTVNPALAKGVITPSSTTEPTPMGESNYTKDYFRFFSEGGTMTLTAHNGSQFLSVGTADPGPTLRSTLRVLTRTGEVVGIGTEAADTLSETYSGTLPAGWYVAEVASFGGHEQTLSGYNTTYYYDMGSYFLTGSGVSAVPEPGTLALLVIAVCLAIMKRCPALRGK